MATLNIAEFVELASNASGQIPAGKTPAIAHQNVTFTTTTQSAAFNDKTNFVRIYSDADAVIEFGTNPTAAAPGIMVTAGVAEYFGVPRGESYKVAAVTA